MLSRDIAGLLPLSGKRFVDVFCGRGNVSFAVMQLLDYEQYWMNDLQTFPFLDGLRHSRIYAVPERQGKTAHLKMKARTVDKVRWKESYRQARPGKQDKTLVQPTPLLESYLCYSGGTYSSKVGARSGRGGGVSREGYEKKVRLAYEIMQRTEPRITRLDYLDVLAECGPGDVLFFDPPYPGAKVSAYSDKMLEFGGLVNALLTAKFKWVLSGYKNEIYKPLGKPFRTIEVRKTMSNANNNSGKRKKAVECFWKNF